jgi:hypothetical protein
MLQIVMDEINGVNPVVLILKGSIFDSFFWTKEGTLSNRLNYSWALPHRILEMAAMETPSNHTTSVNDIPIF